MRTLSIKTGEALALLQAINDQGSTLMGGSASMALAVSARQLQTVYDVFNEKRTAIFAAHGGQQHEDGSVSFAPEGGALASGELAGLMEQYVEVRLPVLSDAVIEGLTLTPAASVALLPLTSFYEAD